MAKASREFLYGLNPAFEALKAERRKFYQAFINEATAHTGRLKVLTQKIQDRGIPVEWTDKGRLQQLCGAKEHQGIVLKTDLYPYVPYEELFQAAPQRLLMMDNVEDPHNVGAILRTADIFGFHHVLLPIKGVPEIYPSVSKVAAGASEYMHICKELTASTCVQKAMEAGYHLAALDGKGTVDLEDLSQSMPERLLLIIGGEDKSVGQFILNQAHSIVSIRQHGHINSLNASVAASIAMYALRPR